MSIHRDDHEAALARIDALEEDLRRSVRAAEAANRLADETKHELDALRRNQPKPVAPEPKREPVKPRRTSLLMPPREPRRVELPDPDDLARAKHGMNVGFGAMLIGIFAAVCGGSWLAQGPRESDLTCAVTVTTLGSMVAIFGLVLVCTAVRPRE